jgi:hypothetical protein
MRDDGAWSLVVVMPPAMRNILRVWQLETRNLAGSVYPASTVAMVQVRAALADLGIDTPPVVVQRTGTHAALDSAADRARAMATGDPRRVTDRLQLRMEPQRFAVLAEAARKHGYRSPQEAVVAWVMSRAEAPVPLALSDGTLRPPRGNATRSARGATFVRHGGAEKPHRKRERAVDGVDYVAAHLRLCRERAARDAWQRRGGRGKAPESTVDDHLGRTVRRGDPRMMGTEALLRGREEMGGRRSAVDTSGMVRTYDGIGRARYSWERWQA